MDLSFSEEQTILRDTIRKFVEKDYSFEARRKILGNEEGFSRRVWSQFAELGWTCVPFAETDGGLGGGALDTALVMEELGRGLVLEPYFTSIVFSGAFLRRAASALREQHIPSLIDGSAICAVAFAEPNSRYNLASVCTKAAKSGSGYTLSGRKAVVLGGACADQFVVTARTSGGDREERGLTLFVVDAKAKGLTRRSYKTVDGLRAAELQLEGVEIGGDQVIGTVDGGHSILTEATDEALVALGAEGVGVMEVLYKSTIAYAKERRQFGVPISSFQALQHRMVDMFMAHEQTKSMLYMAAMKLDAKDDVAKAASALKVQVGRAGRAVGQEAIQIHGGMGMTEELAVSHYFKRMTMIDTFLGDADHHLNRFASLS